MRVPADFVDVEQESDSPPEDAGEGGDSDNFSDLPSSEFDCEAEEGSVSGLE